jgi:hypothetical protein
MVLIILQYGITHGTELTIVASAFMYGGKLLREYAAVEEYEPEIISEIKLESVGDAAERVQYLVLFLPHFFRDTLLTAWK